jgi:hypothetical protein
MTQITQISSAAPQVLEFPDGPPFAEIRTRWEREQERSLIEQDERNASLTVCAPRAFKLLPSGELLVRETQSLSAFQVDVNELIEELSEWAGSHTESTFSAQTELWVDDSTVAVTIEGYRPSTDAEARLCAKLRAAVKAQRVIQTRQPAVVSRHYGTPPE